MTELIFYFTYHSIKATLNFFSSSEHYNAAWFGNDVSRSHRHCDGSNSCSNHSLESLNFDASLCVLCKCENYYGPLIIVRSLFIHPDIQSPTIG